jgi:CheY-like chemotaxis protein/HPt (histidine-containing phosphotransfer) domain-containing protein
MLELLARSKLDSDQAMMVEVVRESGRSLQRIVDDILDFSKIEAGKLDLHPVVTSVPDLIDSVLHVYSGNASGKGLAFRRYIDERISPVVVDSMRLRQILGNFIGNAIKFTSDGHIEVRAELTGHTEGLEIIRFSVRDTGIGISAEHQKQLFQPFVQAHADIAQRFGGTGLGLSICRRLATLMGGTVGVTSELGMGTTMMLELRLPIADSKLLPAPLEERASARTGAAGAPRRDPSTVAEAEAARTLILLVDDHPVNRMVLMRQVNMLGYAAEDAENGVVALKMWRSGRFAAVITDCNMPEMNGYELARNIRSVEAADRRPRTPIIACTANALEGEAENCLAAGMDDYVPKPIQIGILAEKLDRWAPFPPAHGPAQVTASPIDNAVLAEITDGDDTLAREILHRFRRYNSEDAASLKAAVDATDLRQVTDASHRIKGASRTVGAVALATVCEHLERAGRANDWLAISSHMDAFRHEVHRLDRFIESFGE